MRIVLFMRTVLFYVVSAFFMLVVIAPVGNIWGIFCSKETATKWLIFAGKGLAIIFRICIGVKITYRGVDNLPKGPCIIASKHQSAYDTFVVFNKFYPRAAYVAKAEFGLAFFYIGLLYRKYNGIIVKRSDGAKALIYLEKQALECLSDGRQVVIFPEGTRVPFGETLPFKRGIERIYEKANVPVVPVALNTGSVMPKNSKLLYPGHILIDFLPPIMPGLNKADFMQQLESTINQATHKLEKETPCNLYLRERNLC